MNYKIGDKVTYCPMGIEIKSHGIIKSFAPNGEGAFVVYNCNNEWERYKDFTAAATNIIDLKPGWI